jgi:hypothetical protein
LPSPCRCARGREASTERARIRPPYRQPRSSTGQRRSHILIVILPGKGGFPPEPILRDPSF